MSQNKPSQKTKLVKILEILRQETDEQNPISRMDLRNRLCEMGYITDPRTLSLDIAQLNEDGFEIMSAQKGHEKVYYVEDRNFSDPELIIMIDAIQAASFVTEKKTEELTSKIANLGGRHKAAIMKMNMVRFNNRKHSNESIYYSVGFLKEALQKKSKVSFKYYDLNEKGEKVFRKNKRYVVEPLSLIYNEDNYYLVCYSSKYNNLCNYRVDKMDNLDIEKEPISKEAKKVMKDIRMDKYTEQIFKMYGGKTTEVILEFNEPLISVVFDKFGEGTRMIRTKENKIKTNVSVQVSPTFFGWIAQFGNDMKILKPDTVRKKYINYLKEIIENE